MHFIIYISVGFIAMQLINVLLNALFRQKIQCSQQQNSELISVLIPARNEEANIDELLRSLQQTKNDKLEIIVFDDNSSDNTAHIVQQFCETDNRVQLIRSVHLPKDWLGKNHACYQLAQHARGNYFLFIDSDIKVNGNIAADAVSYLQKHRLGLVSVFPTQIQKTIGEKISVPIMNYILLTLLPLIFVRVSPFTSHAAANGQFMLFDAEIYRKLQPHRLVKESPVEDIAISRLLKKQKIKIACLAGEKRIECRMYHSYSDALNGFSKNIFMFFGNVPLLAFLFWVCACFGIVPVILFEKSAVLIYLAAMALIQVLYSVTSKQNVIYNILFFPVQLLFMLHVMLKAIITHKNKNYTWKGRNIY